MLAPLLSLTEKELARKTKRELIEELANLKQSLAGLDEVEPGALVGRPSSPEQRFLEAIEAVPSAFALFDPEDRLVTCNQQFYRFQELSPEDVPPGTPFEFFVRSIAERGLVRSAAGREEEFIRERMERHRNPSGRYELQRPSGNWWRIHEQRVADGSTLYIASDITDEKAAEEQLKASEERFRNLIEGSIQGILIHRNLKPLFANQALAHIHGYDSSAEILALDSIAQIQAPSERARLASYTEARDQGLPAPASYVMQGLRKDGSLVWRENIVSKVMWEGEEAVQITTQDISERKRAEEELRISRERMAGILNIADDAIISVNEEQRIVMFNKGAERTFGYRADEVMARPLEILLPADFKEAHHKHLESFAQSPETSRRMSDRTEVLARRKDGEEFPADASISKLETGEGRIFTVILRDITKRKQTEEALGASRRLLRTAFDAIPHNIAVKDTEGRYLMVNKALCDFMNMPAEAFLNRRVPELPGSNDTDKEMIVREDRQFLESGKTLSVSEYRATTHDGKEKDLQGIRSLLKDENGIVTGTLAIAMDITERLQAAQQAKAAHERLVDAVESLPQGFALLDPDDRLVLWNEQYATANNDIADMLEPGVPFEEMIRNVVGRGKRNLEGLDPDEWLRRRMKFHNNPGNTLETQSHDGRWFLISERKTREGGTTGVWTDITELKRAEEALRAREEQLQLFIRHAPAAVAMFDRDMRYLVHSRRWVEDFNLGQEDLNGRYHKDVFPESPDSWSEAFQSSLAGTVERREEDSFQLADGTIYWVRWETHPWRNLKGEINGVVMFTEVINERKKAEAQLIRAQRMEAVGQITGGVAHEFNNLLHIIQSYAYLLEEELVADEKLSVLVKPIKNASQRGADLVKRLLAFSRRQLLQPKLIDLNLVTLEMIELLRPPLGEAIELTTVASERLWPVKVDQGELENALINLALNARDAMPQGGKLTIKTRNWTSSPGEDENGGGAEARRYVVLSVSDSGSGMTTEVQERAFEPFFTTKGLAEHSGLGLSMVHGFVNQSGGYVEIESVYDSGTTIALFLPSAEEE